MKFLADMGISPQTVSLLREHGHDAIHLHEERLDRLPDPLILEKARRERRVLLTHDLDFAELMAASGANLPSVVIFRLRDMRPDSVNRHLRIILRRHLPSLAQGGILSVTDGRIRSRMLPLGNDGGPDCRD